MRTLAFGGVIVLTACGPSAGIGDAESSTGVDSTSSGVGMTGVADVTGTSNTGTGTSSESSSGGTSSESGESGDSTGEPASVCNPQPEDVRAIVWFEADDSSSQPIVVDAPCELVQIVVADAHRSQYTFVCDEPSGPTDRLVEISADPWPELPLVVGTRSHLLVHSTAYIDLPQRLYLALRDDADELVLGYYGDVDVPIDVDVGSLFSPFELAIDTAQCEPEPYTPPDDDGSFLVDPCPSQLERAAFMVHSPWATGLVYDDTAAPFGEYEVRVNFARTYFPQGPPEECPTLPEVSGSVALIRE